jgi:hypothetical protein
LMIPIDIVIPQLGSVMNCYYSVRLAAFQTNHS